MSVLNVINFPTNNRAYTTQCHFSVDKLQFWSETFKYCIYCDEIKEECGTASQPSNCTEYCQGRKSSD
jgi:hypothetical protein